MYTNYEFTQNDGWRILDPGTYDESTGKYSGVKLISTGIPAKLYYDSGHVKAATWAGTASQITDYTNRFYASNSATNNNMYAAADLYYNFGRISFNQGTSINTNNGGYVKVNGKTTGRLSETEFLTNEAEEVHNLTMYELNEARNKKAGSTVYELNQTDGISSYSRITPPNDAATGLFYLIGLNKYGYVSSSSPYYWLASPYSESADMMWYVYYGGNLEPNRRDTYGVRPVVSLKSDVTLEIVGN